MPGELQVQRLTVDHKTTYRYRRPVAFGEHRLMFRPRDSHDLRLLDARLSIRPAAEIRWLHDVFGNSVAVARFEESADELFLQSTIVLDRYPMAEARFAIEPFARTLPFSYPAREVPDLCRTTERHFSDQHRVVTEWSRRFLAPHGATVTEEFLVALTGAISREFTYEARHAPGVQAPIETLDRGAGTCRDFAMLMMESVRGVGLAARFVSGYLYDPAFDGGSSDLQGAGYTHAWVQIYLPGAGWVEFDPTNGSYGGHNLVPVAMAREPAQAVPVSGTFDGVEGDFLDLTVEVSVHAVRILDNIA
jgi:transglutaminase-like putative cysteine protease